MPSATLRRTGAARAADPLFGGCTLHVPSARRPLTACQELPPTAAATPHLHALVAVPPLPRVPARAPAARRLAIAEQCLLLSGLGSELGAGFRAGGRAVNLGCKRLLSKEKNRNLPCALDAWTSEDRCMSRDNASCARTAEAGVIPGRHCGESRVPSSRASFSEGLASMWCARRRHGWARYITERASKPRRRCLISHIECHINRAAGGSANVFWQRRSGAFAWAPRAIPEPGCGLKRTVRWLMSVVRCRTFKRRCRKSLSTVNRDGERAFVPPSRLAWAGGGVNFPDRDWQLFSANEGYSATRECFLCHIRPSDNRFCDFRFHEPP